MSQSHQASASSCRPDWIEGRFSRSEAISLQPVADEWGGRQNGPAADGALGHLYDHALPGLREFAHHAKRPGRRKKLRKFNGLSKACQGEQATNRRQPRQRKVTKNRNRSKVLGNKGCARSSAGQSNGLLIRRPQVRILPGAPIFTKKGADRLKR